MLNPTVGSKQSAGFAGFFDFDGRAGDTKPHDDAHQLIWRDFPAYLGIFGTPKLHSKPHPEVASPYDTKR